MVSICVFSEFVVPGGEFTGNKSGCDLAFNHHPTRATMAYAISRNPLSYSPQPQRMTLPQAPKLAAADDLTEADGIDLNGALAQLTEQRLSAPIIRPSCAADIAALVDESFPSGGDSLEDLAAQLTAATGAYPRRNTHPGFFGWIAPSGLPSDPLAHAMVATLNENIGGYWASPVGTTIERTVIRWLAELAGFKSTAEGVFVSGGSIANMTGLASACAKQFGPDFRRQGLTACNPSQRPVILCSREAHFSVRRAAVMLGLGTDTIVYIDVDTEFRMRTDRLADALKQHQNVICVIATAGTTNTGAIDPLETIAELCAQHGTWLHVDAACGGGGLMSEQLRPRFRGIDQADSIIMDLHKWFYQSLGGSLLLYRDASWARQLFYESSDYLHSSEDPVAEQYSFFHISPELSRRFRALPFYMAMRCYGLPKLGRNVWHNVQCANYLADLIRQTPDLELVAAPQLSILCFRYRPAESKIDDVDRINRAIRDQIQLEGDYLMSASQIHGRPVLRVCIMNHATRAEQIDGLLASVLRIGRQSH